MNKPSKSEKTKVPFKLSGITTEQYATFQENYLNAEADFDINFSLNIKIDKEGKLVGLFTRFTFLQEEQPVLLLECACHFVIDSTYWKSQTKGNELTLPAGLITHFIMLTIGTARGIIHAKKPKWLSHILLPTFDVSNIISGDQVYNLNEEEE